MCFFFTFQCGQIESLEKLVATMWVAVFGRYSRDVEYVSWISRWQEIYRAIDWKRLGETIRKVSEFTMVNGAKIKCRGATPPRPPSDAKKMAK